ncbi:MAG: hypothetical protein ACPGQL_03880 [Thermoplasmatota archaeon]
MTSTARTPPAAPTQPTGSDELLSAGKEADGVLTVQINDDHPTALERGRVFVVLTMLLAAGLLGAVLGLNVLVNPRSRFDTDVYEPLIPDYAHEKLEAYHDLPAKPAVVVMGSSRALKIDPDALGNATGRVAYNFALPGASLEDHLTLYRYMAERRWAPEQLFIGLEEVQLAGGIEPKLERSRAWPELGGQTGLWGDAKVLYETLTPGHVKDVGRSLYFAHVKGGLPEPRLALAADGEGIYPVFERHIAAGTFDQEAELERHWRNEALATYQAVLGLDQSKLAVLDTLLAEARGHDTRVTLFFTPFHPDAWERLLELPDFEQVHDAAKATVAERCADAIRVFDFTHVDDWGGDPASFYDNFHYRADNAALLVAEMTARDPAERPNALCQP